MLDLDSNLMGLLEGTLFLPIRAVDVIKWLFVVSGIGLGVTAAFLKFRKNRMDKVHILNAEEVVGEAQQSTAEFEPKPTLRMDDLQKHQQTHDPSYIPDNKPNTRVIENGLSAVALMKNVSTMTSANGIRQHSVEKTTHPPNMIDRKIELPYLHFKRHEEDGYDCDEKVSESFDPVTIDIPATGNEERAYPGLSILQERSPLALTSKSPTKSLELQLSSGEIPISEQPIVENLSQEPASIHSSSTQKTTFPLASPQPDQVILPRTLTDYENETRSLETNDTTFQRIETIGTSADSRPTAFNEVNEFDNTVFGGLDLFGETVSRHSSEDDTTIFNNIDNSNNLFQEGTGFRMNQNVPIYKETQNSTQPTDQEIKLVEQDINKLISEISLLMPKNN